MTVSGHILGEDFKELLLHLDGPLNNTASYPCSPEYIQKNSILFITSEKNLSLAIESDCSIMVVPEKLKSSAIKLNEGRKLIFTSFNPTYAMALINRKYFSPYPNKMPFDKSNIHTTAIISPTAQIDKTVIIGPYSVIGAHCVLNKNVIIGSHTTVESSVHIDEGSHIHSQVFIGHDVKIGKNVEVLPQSSVGSEGYGYAQNKVGHHYRIPHLGSVQLGDNVHLGSAVNIDRGTYGDTIIGEGTKIDNHCHIAHNSKIGKHCLMTAGFICAGSAVVGDYCVFGGRASVTGHVTLADKVTIGPLTGVINNITEPGMYGGFPEMPFSEFRRSYATIRQLPKMRKILSKVARKLGIEED